MNERWPWLLGPPSARARMRVDPEDFQVEEIPAYPTSGTGEHLFIEIEKVDLNTEQVVRALAEQLRLKPGAIGSAGRKDKRAVTRQWLSLPASAKAAVERFEMPGVRVLRTGLHTNKLKTGHLKGNRFRIRLRGVGHEHHQDLEARLADLARRGAANYFGPQRFGRDGRNEAEGIAILTGRGKRVDRKSLRFLLSAVQSALFNDVLADRIRTGLFDRVLAGDILVKADTGGRFVCQQPDEDQPRADRLEVHPTGPMFGPKMKVPEGQVAEAEGKVMAAAGLKAQHWRRFAKLTRGTRRALRVVPEGLTHRFDGDDLELAFGLPSGAYATAVIAELAETGDST